MTKDENILRLQVAIDDRILMQIHEPVGELCSGEERGLYVMYVLYSYIVPETGVNALEHTTPARRCEWAGAAFAGGQC